jgi:predicted house-cleaning noncanonical NTP pyrophosphatase (MazG superfamily)
MAQKIVYNKLVRDKIPQIIQASGKTCNTEVLSEERYLQMLDRKIDEELLEFRKEPSEEELADLLEVLYAMAKARGWSIERVHQVRDEKKKARGGFEERILLQTVETP